jgi:hypothetical protein
MKEQTVWLKQPILSMLLDMIDPELMPLHAIKPTLTTRDSTDLVKGDSYDQLRTVRDYRQ